MRSEKNDWWEDQPCQTMPQHDTVGAQRLTFPRNGMDQLLQARRVLWGTDQIKSNSYSQIINKTRPPNPWNALSNTNDDSHGEHVSTRRNASANGPDRSPGAEQGVLGAPWASERGPEEFSKRSTWRFFGFEGKREVETPPS